MEEISKEGVIRILMRRDNLTREDAEETVQICIDDMQEAIEAGEGHDALQDIVQDNLGLEPDYIMCLIGLE